MAEPSGSSGPSWREVRRIFLAALELPEGDRAEQARREAGGDRELEAEVLSLLASHAASDDRLEPPLAERMVGPYRLIRELGRGGMGTVYLATRTDGDFVQSVALKVLKRGMDTDEIVQRFRAERQALAALDHPCIARIMDGGSTPEGLPYFAMEFVDGAPIDDYCDQHHLDERARLELFVRVCGAVVHAHQRLIVHRDIKPANVLVARAPAGSGDHPVPKLLDFGIAKLLDVDGPRTAAPLHTRTPWMTPEYASPEQARGEAVGTSTDVYSLGALLYRLLAGRPPFETPPTEPRLPAPLTSSAERRRVSRDLETVVMHALEPDVARRYPSAAALAEDVTRYLQGLPVQARPATAMHRARLFVRRNAAVVGALAGVFLLLLATLVVVLAQSAAARDEATKAREINVFLAWLLGCVDPSNEGRNVDFAAVVDLAAERVENEFTDHPEVRAALQDTLGRTYHNLGRFDEAERFLEAALATRRATLGDRAEDTLVSVEHLGELLFDLGRLDGALALATEALDAREGGDDPLALANVLNLLGLIQENLGRYEEAAASLERAIALRREHLGESEELVLSLNNLALVRSSTGRQAESRALVTEAIDILRRLFDRPHPTLATALYNSGVHELGQGFLELAEQRLAEAFDLRVGLLGEEHPDTVRAMGALGEVLVERGELARGEELTRRASEAVCTKLGEGYPCASSLYGRGKALAYQGRYDEALATLERSLAIYRQLGETDSAPVTVEGRIVVVLFEAGRFDEVHRRAPEVIRLCRDAEGNFRFSVTAGDVLTADARAWLAQGDLARAREGLASVEEIPQQRRSRGAAWTLVGRADLAARDGDATAEVGALRAALAVLDEKLPGPSLMRTWIEHRLGRALWNAGERDEARALLRASTARLDGILPAAHPGRALVDEWRGRGEG